MKSQSQYGEYDSEYNLQRKPSLSKNLISREIFGQQNRKKRRMHTNSILNQLKLAEKINQQNPFISYQNGSNPFESSKKSSIRLIKSRKRMSDFNLKCLENTNSCRISNFFECSNKNSQMQQDLSPSMQNKQKVQKKSQNKENRIKDDKKFVIHEKKKSKQKQPRNLILSSINNKLREISLISKTFDKVNEYYYIDSDHNEQGGYQKKSSQTFMILKDFQSKLNLRKNMITQRKNSLKKNIKLEYRYKVLPKRYQTEAPQKQNNDSYSIFFENIIGKNHGIWHEDARKLKNYISGGYTDEKQEFSDFTDLQDYRNLKKNFKTFEHIYNGIKQDKDKPIAKVYMSDMKKPNILQIVSAMEKQLQKQSFKTT